MVNTVVTKTAIIGAGSLGEQFLNFLLEVQLVDPIFFDDVMLQHNAEGAFAFEDYRVFDFTGYSAYIGLGYRHLSLKENIYDFLKSKKVLTPNYFHAQSYFNAGFQSGDANFIFPLCSFEKGVVVGNGNVFNAKCSVSHDSTIGDFCFFGPGVTMSGNVKLGGKCFVGSGCVFANNVTVGSGCTIGAGTLVSSDLPAGSAAVGNPMRILNEPLNLV